MTGHSSFHPACRAAAITATALAAFAGTATATAEPLRLEPSTSTGQAEDVGHSSTPSGSGNSGTIDTTGSYEADAFVGSAAPAFTIDHPFDMLQLTVAFVGCHAATPSGDPSCRGTGHLP